jgi:hypothetical protein
MKRLLATAMLASALVLPVTANAAENSSDAPSSAVAQLAMSGARFTVIDQNGNVVAVLASGGSDTLVLRRIGTAKAAAAIATPRTFHVDDAKALTTQQADAAYHAAYDEFFGICRD